MEKIPTYFLRDETQPGRPVIDQVHPECGWVAAGEGVATVKFDGQNVKIEGGRFFRRKKPADDVPYDRAAYVECDRADPADKHLWAAFDQTFPEFRTDGIYEAVGPKIQNNPDRLVTPRLIRVVPMNPLYETVAPRSYEGLREYLLTHTMEGLVFHHPDGRMAKIKRRDYRLPWPLTG